MMYRFNTICESSRGIDLVPLDDRLLSESNIFLTGTICRESSNEIIKQLFYLNRKSDVEKITLYVDSDGGSVQAGFALYDIIRMIKKPVRTVILGQACSMAAIIFLAADIRLMLPHAKIMIHDPAYGGEHNVAGKKPHEIQLELDELNKCRTRLAEIISERTGKNIKEVYKKTKDDSFFDVDEAINFGLCNGIYDLNERK